jgi:hypothetical protein
LAAAWGWLALCRPRLAEKLPHSGLVIWNLVFTLSLVGTIVAQRVSFPQTPGSVTVVGGTITFYQTIPLVLMLLLFPELFLDMQVFVNRIRQQSPSPGELIPGLLLGSTALLLLVFINIFTNVWGYISPVSTPFRNLFWLPFLLCAGALTLLIGIRKNGEQTHNESSGGFSWVWTVILGLIFLGRAGWLLAYGTRAVRRRESFIAFGHDLQHPGSQ